MRKKRPVAGAKTSLTKEMHGLRSARARANLSGTSSHSLRKERGIFADKKQLSGSSLAHRKRPVITKGKTISQAGAIKTGRRGRQYETIRPSNFEADQIPTPNAIRNVKASTLYVIKASPGKGLGMFAAEDIRKGTRILAEKPFFSLTKRPVINLSDPQAPNEISIAFDRLSTSEQHQYLGLHCPQRPGCSRGVTIYEANCYEMGSGTCICLDAARINHSCVPNAHYSWNASIERQTVHAVKDIFKGEEITISYCSAIRTLEKRKRDLKPYVFACTCSACQTDTWFGTRSQIRRQQMLDLHHEIADYQNDLPAARAEYGYYDEEYAILRIVSLMEEEGLVHTKSLAYHDAAECALKRGLRERALKYARKELDVDLCCVGRDSPLYKETLSFFLRIYFGAEEEV